MAITTYRNTLNTGYASTAVILQLESAFDWLGWHGGTVSGICTGVDSFSGWSQVGSSSTDFHDVRPKTSTRTTGIGSTASFYVDRSGGNVNKVYVNRGGAGYQDGDSFVLAGEDIGGGNDMTVVVKTDGGSTSYGSTSTFYKKQLDNTTSPFGVLRLPVADNKIYGDTYWGFQLNGSTMYMTSGSSFFPVDNPSSRDSEFSTGMYPNSFRGRVLMDVGYFGVRSSNNQLKDTSYNQYHYDNYLNMTFQSSNSFKLDLSVFRSGLDPNFAVLSYRHPEKSATKIGDNTYATFVIHNYTNDIFDNDHVFLGSVTEICETTNQTYNNFDNVTTLGGVEYQDYPKARSALHGYAMGQSNNIESRAIDQWRGMTYDYFRTYAGTYGLRMYYRNNDGDANQRSNIDVNNTGDKSLIMPDGANYNAVIKGIPLCAKLYPVPYYMPDDFVMIQFDYAAPDQNIQQWDTIEVSGSEIYTVINGVYNQTTRTRGILFCARTTG